MRNKMQQQLDAMLEGHTIIRMENGYKIRRKPGPKREQVLHDKAFKGSRKSLSDFLQASSSGKVLRTALHEIICTTKDKDMHNRLTSVLHKVIASAPAAACGKKLLAEGSLHLLRRFEFGGSRHTLSNTFFATYTTHIDTAKQEALVEIPAFRPTTQLRCPGGVTHVKFRAVFAMIDFEAGATVNKTVLSEAISLHAAQTAGTHLHVQLPEEATGCGFLAFGISLFDGKEEVYGGAAVIAEVAEAAQAIEVELPVIEAVQQLLPAAVKQPEPRRKRLLPAPCIAITPKPSRKHRFTPLPGNGRLKSSPHYCPLLSPALLKSPRRDRKYSPLHSPSHPCNLSLHLRT
ncbi:hypothetical protein MKQ70_07905 [Chitinophaga sedimenti]|uniref:hypothetical protein n=1 Tax=Chitinophaga sedimenti TaxID=2033606 RepID=UPI00200662BE|nr:hypothetical protein [Chitinophaga sedimenti]MCK7554932.1 hypothetical protein [Chitinophaga sedimenti]